jgi:GNAT superfamily N-acetyltransferase
MIFKIEAISYAQWKTAIEPLNKERKWLLFIPNIKEIEFFTIRLIVGNKMNDVGAGYFKKLDDTIDWSFCILPNFQRKGIARNFVNHVLNHTPNPQFTVSKFNNTSMCFFSSLEGLKEFSFDSKSNTQIFYRDN